MEVGQKLIIPYTKTKPKRLAKSKKYIPQKNEEDSLGFFGKVKNWYGDIREDIRIINKKKWSDNAKRPGTQKIGSFFGSWAGTKWMWTKINKKYI